ncbi:tape measure protein [Nocardia sp. NPDC004151]|uniref:tape measure protein n=1 Tax=Nocardia sp. NPDC004151 TaxID=3364304 RepID=UPI003697D517
MVVIAVELGTAYVSLAIESKDIPKQVEKGLKAAEPAAERSGHGIGSRLAAGIGTTLKTTAAGVGLAAGAVIGTALQAGFQRMTAIDDARGKLAGLGHEAQSVSTIMGSALDAVKGTAYGLGDAATIAASAVAAGVKPGEDLTRYLKLTADAATIAGTSLGDMGSILNKVTTSGKAYTDDLNMLSDRGIPIFTWLQEAYGKSADGLSDMVKQGKVDAATFQKVIQDHIGGAALQSGKTLKGAWSNLHAALGRIGEGALGPFLPMMKNGLAVATQWADRVTPRVKEAAQRIAYGLTDLGHAFQTNGASIDGNASAYEQWGVRLRHAVDGTRGVWSILKDGQYQGSAMTFGLEEDSPVVGALFRIREAAIALRDVLKSPGGEKFQAFMNTLKGSGDQASGGLSKVRESGSSVSAVMSKLGSASADVGKSLVSLAGDTGTVAAAGIRVIGSAMRFLANHTGVAAAAMVGFVAMRGITEVATAWGNIGRGITGIFTPATLLATRAQTAALVEHTAVQRAYLAALGAEVPAQQQSIRQRFANAVATARQTVATQAASSALGQFAARQAEAAASSGLLLAGLRNTTAAAATAGARIQATAVTAFGGLQRAGAGLVSVLGGPWGIAITAASVAGYGLWEMLNRNKREARDLADELKHAIDTMDTLTGKQTQETIDATAQRLSEHGGRIDQAAGFGIDRNAYVLASAGMDEDARKRINAELLANIVKDSTVQKRASSAGVSVEDLAKAVQGDKDAVSKTGLTTGYLDDLREHLGSVAQASVDLSKAMNTEAEANGKASSAAQQYIKDTRGQFEATDSLKAKVAELGGTIAGVPQKNVVEISSPPGMDPETFKNKVNDLHLGVVELEADGKTIKLVLDDSQYKDAITKVKQETLPPKTQNIMVQMINQAAIDSGRPPVVTPAQPRATGGSINGAGTGTSDSIPALLSHGEHVWTAREVDAVGGQSAMYGLRARALAGGLRFATGGGVPGGISDAIKAAQEAEAHTYQWGGVGLNNFDCSGFVGFLQQVAMGLGKVAKRIYTTTTLIGGATAGLESGLGPAGTWFQVGASNEHMAATIAGLNVESGGQYGTSGIGAGRAGAGDSQFPFKFHLPNSLIAGINSLTTGGTISTWTDENERELERLKIAVDDAKKKRDETYAKSDSSASDKRKADLDVADAQDAVVKKQGEKDKAGQSVGGSRIAPQAPVLSKKYSDNEKTYASALQAVEQANKARNEVYDNPESTDADKQVADINLQEAISKLENNDSSKSPAKTVKDIFTTWASSVAGVAFDAFKTQLPDKISGSHWWDVADQAVSLVNSDDTQTGTSISQALQNIGSFGASAFAGQLGYNSKRDVPDWVRNLKSAAVYDTGGWLPPGGMAVNLSNSPEPIFNSPKQLQEFAGSALQPAQGGDTMTRADIERLVHTRPNVTFNVTDVPAAMHAWRTEQKRQAATYIRR